MLQSLQVRTSITLNTLNPRRVRLHAGINVLQTGHDGRVLDDVVGVAGALQG